MMHSLYFIGYALLATVSTIIIAWGQYTLYKDEGTPFNFTLLMVVIGVALAMWTGAALTAFAYGPSTTTTGLAAFSLGTSFSIFFAWQVNKVIKKIQSDEKALDELSTHDSLTGLWNRRMFHEYLNSEHARLIRSKQPLSLVMLRSDNLSQINATYGYKSGDMVLRQLGTHLSESVRSIDRACRYRSDKIALILPQADSEAAQVLAVRLQSLLADIPFDVGNESPLILTFSMGIASYSEHIDSDDSLISGATSAMDIAKKRNGGNCISVVGRGECRLI